MPEINLDEFELEPDKRVLIAMDYIADKFKLSSFEDSILRFHIVQILDRIDQEIPDVNSAFREAMSK